MEFKNSRAIRPLHQTPVWFDCRLGLSWDRVEVDLQFKFQQISSETSCENAHCKAMKSKKRDFKLNDKNAAATAVCSMPSAHTHNSNSCTAVIRRESLFVFFFQSSLYIIVHIHGMACLIVVNRFNGASFDLRIPFHLSINAAKQHITVKGKETIFYSRCCLFCLYNMYLG